MKQGDQLFFKRDGQLYTIQQIIWEETTGIIRQLNVQNEKCQMTIFLNAPHLMTLFIKAFKYVNEEGQKEELDEILSLCQASSRDN